MYIPYSISALSKYNYIKSKFYTLPVASTYVITFYLNNIQHVIKEKEKKYYITLTRSKKKSIIKNFEGFIKKYIKRFALYKNVI